MEAESSQLSKGSRSFDFWEHHINEAKKAGLKAASYCRQHGLKENQFCYWKKKVESINPKKPAESVAKRSPGFIQLKVPKKDESCRHRIEVCGKVVVESSKLPDADWLSQLTSSLSS